MNTNNIYYSLLHITTGIEDYSDDYVRVNSKSLRSALVLIKSSLDGKLRIKDLHTKEKYMTEMPLKVGRLFINPKYLLPFNFFNNVPSKLSKKEILEIGNKNLIKAKEVLIENATVKKR